MQNSFDPQNNQVPKNRVHNPDSAPAPAAAEPDPTICPARQLQNLVRVDLPGVSFSTTHRRNLIKLILDSLAPGATAGLMVGYINPHVYVLATNTDSRNQPDEGAEDIARFLSQADLVSIDGTGIQVGLFFRQRRWLQRVVAEHLFNDLLANISHPIRAVLIGAGPGIAEKAAAAMHECNPQFEIIATMDGYGDYADYQQMLQEHADVDLVLIGAGTPRSERIALDAREISPRSVIFHIGGGTLNTWAGTKQRAPRWLSFCGCEWLHRMMFEPHTRSRYTSGGRVFLQRFFSSTKTSDRESKQTDSVASSNPDMR